MSLPELNLTIRRGATVAIPIQLETDVLKTAAITAISRSAPVSITAAMHGIPNNWKAAVVCAGGMRDINASGYPPRNSEMQRVTVVDTNTVEFNKVSSACFKPYTSGGYLVFYEPLDLANYTDARMQVRNCPDGELLAEFSTDDGTLEIDDMLKCVWIRLTPAQSRALDFASGMFDIELLTAGGDVTPVCSAASTIELTDEITEDA